MRHVRRHWAAIAAIACAAAAVLLVLLALDVRMWQTSLVRDDLRFRTESR